MPERPADMDDGNLNLIANQTGATGIRLGPFRQLRRRPEDVRAELGDRPHTDHLRFLLDASATG